MDRKRCAELAVSAMAVVKSSASFLASLSDSRTRIVSEEGKDIKLDADIQMSRRLEKSLSEISEYKCLSEESNKQIDISGNTPCWVIDPVDGSMNYSRDIPFYCISAALWYRQKALIGVIYDAARKSCYCSFNGKARVDNEPISVGRVETIGKSILSTGIPVLFDMSKDGIGEYLHFIQKFKKIRMLGSAALSLAWVAQGRLDIYFERDIMIWDVAAGIAVVEGAGGQCVIRDGRHPFSVDVVAGNRVVVKEMCDLLGWET